jgi:hypothetical protein
MESGCGIRNGRDVGHVPVAVHLGEIHTGMLQNSGPISAEIARQVLSTLPHQRVRSWERPIRRAASPEVLTGLDHALPSASGTHVRGVGTLATELRVTAGRLLQAGTRATVVQSAGGRRLSWSYYLARPSTVETIGQLSPLDLVEGFLRDDPRGDFDLGAVCTQWMGWAQSSVELDRRSPFPARRTRLRWAAVTGSPALITFRVHDECLRSIKVVAPAPMVGDLQELCHDVALHDWLLSSLVSLIDTAAIGQRNREEVLARLRPAVDHLLHAWMPSTRFRDDLAPFWTALEYSSGLARQWENAVDQVRDQVRLAAALRTVSGVLQTQPHDVGVPAR